MNGVWQSDGSRHTVRDQVTSRREVGPSVTIPAQSGKRTLKVLYLFSGISRKASIAEYIAKRCERETVTVLNFWKSTS